MVSLFENKLQTRVIVLVIAVCLLFAALPLCTQNECSDVPESLRFSEREDFIIADGSAKRASSFVLVTHNTSPAVLQLFTVAQDGPTGIDLSVAGTHKGFNC